MDIDDKYNLLENPTMNSFMKEFQEDVKLTETNLREKSMLCTAIRGKWLQYLFKEHENLRRLKDAKDALMKSKLDTQGNKDSILKLKNEDKLSKDDPKMSRIVKLMQVTKENIDYLEHVQNILSDFPWDIKNKIELVKLERL